jgi:putative flippase GtrA
VTRFIYRLATGIAVQDTQTGLRAFNTGLTDFMLGIKGERYEYEMNVLLECPNNGVAIMEVKIKTVYFDNNSASHFNTVRDSIRIYLEIIKFAASSFISFLVDYGLFSLLSVLLSGLGSGISIPLSNITARIVSASLNYSLNKRFVFRDKGRVLKSAVQYFALAACILVGNTLLLNYFVNSLAVNRYAAKIITEIAFFIISWLVQRFAIFNRQAGGHRNEIL